MSQNAINHKMYLNSNSGSQSPQLNHLPMGGLPHKIAQLYNNLRAMQVILL
jgi:hypothetical protein